jgi:hypothetical protein
MERVGTLIHKLKEQFEQHADAEKLAVTAQLLLAELQQNKMPPVTSSKISVVLPAVTSTTHGEEESIPVPQRMAATPPNNWLFEVQEEVPTIVHHTEIKIEETEPKTSLPLTPLPEFNTLFARQTESLNDKLKEEKTEVATALQTAPIRDLKKAIGVNDRFLFVNELFRGDENMYERSLKTINSFSIYPEAEYWIQRELKVKLSWPDNSETVRLFDQLVRRRFS